MAAKHTVCFCVCWLQQLRAQRLCSPQSDAAEQCRASISHMAYNSLSCVQGQLSCLTKDGKVIMATEHSIAQAPDGNGGVYIALEKCAPPAACPLTPFLLAAHKACRNRLQSPPRAVANTEPICTCCFALPPRFDD